MVALKQFDFNLPRVIDTEKQKRRGGIETHIFGTGAVRRMREAETPWWH